VSISTSVPASRLQLSPILAAIPLAFGLVAAQVFYMVFAVGLKWVVLGRTEPGKYHVHSAYGLRFGMVQSLLTAPFARGFCTLFGETSWSVRMLRALGATLSGTPNILGMSPLMLAGADQIELGSSVTLGNSSVILGAAVVKDTLIIAQTKIKQRYATIFSLMHIKCPFADQAHDARNLCICAAPLWPMVLL